MPISTGPMVHLARSSGPATLTEASELLLVGVSVVFASLVLIWILLNVLRRLVPSDPVPAPVAMPAAAPAAAPVAGADGAPAPLTVALITAAVAAVVGRPFRIGAIRPVADEQIGSAWAEHGRAAHHASHRLRKG